MRSFVLVLLILLAPVVAPAAAQGRPVGMITDLQGPVKATVQGRPVRADVLLQLFPGDRLVLGAGASVQVTWFSDGHREKAAGPAQLEVGAKGLSGGQVARTDPSGALKGLRTQATPGGARGAVTTRTAQEETTGTQPLRVLTSPNAELRMPITDLIPALVDVMDLQGAVVVSALEIGASSTCRVPSRNLQEGKPYVAVARDARGTPVASIVFVYQPADAATMQTLRELRLFARQTENRDDPTPHLAMAQIYDDLGAKDLALQEVHEALARTPSAALLRWASRLSLDLGDDEQAQAYHALAEALEAAPAP